MWVVAIAIAGLICVLDTALDIASWPALCHGCGLWARKKLYPVLWSTNRGCHCLPGLPLLDRNPPFQRARGCATLHRSQDTGAGGWLYAMDKQTCPFCNQAVNADQEQDHVRTAVSFVTGRCRYSELGQEKDVQQ
jgi:hypothetical protein